MRNLLVGFIYFIRKMCDDMNRPRFEGIKMAKIWLTNDYVIIISITINK